MRRQIQEKFILLQELKFTRIIIASIIYTIINVEFGL